VLEPQTAYSAPVSSPHQHVLKPGRSNSGWLTRWMRLDESEASFSVRSFQASSKDAQRRLELIGRTFITGYNSAIERKGLDEISAVLDEVQPELRGFAFEGASMASSLLDLLSLRSSRFMGLLRGPGQQYIHLCWVGTGWACARLKLLHGRFRRKFFPHDPLLSTLAYDGWGFHEGYFSSQRYLRRQAPAPGILKGDTRRIFDQGFGRSLWFVGGARVTAIKSMIAPYPVERQADMWSGVGLACAYAGCAGGSDLEMLLTIDNSFLPHLRQGVAFAAKARVHSGNVIEDTYLAAQLLCGTSPEKLAEVTDAAQRRTNDYMSWRAELQRYFT
jgi:enediyne biosynthesis protein E3